MFLTDETGFKIGTSSQAIIKQWGKPESGDGIEFDYSVNHQAKFMVMDNTVIEIQSTFTKFQNTTVDMMKKQLGKPAETKKTNDGKTLYTYNTGSYKLGVYALSNGNVDMVSVLKPMN